MPRMSPEKRSEVVRRLRSAATGALPLQREALLAAADELESLGQEPADAARTWPESPDASKPWRHPFSASIGTGPDEGPVDECEFCGRPESEHKPKGDRP